MLPIVQASTQFARCSSSVAYMDPASGAEVASTAMRASTIVSTLLISALVLFARPADANPNKVFAGRIMMSEKKFPLQAKSAAAYTAQIKKQSKTNFWENKENHTWKIHFIGFLKTPLNDVEYLVKIYQLGGRQQQLLSTFEQFTDERGQKTLVSSVILDKKQFGVNKELLITMENRGKVLASGRFKILGEGEKFTGKVNFSEEEASGGGE